MQDLNQNLETEETLFDETEETFVDEDESLFDEEIDEEVEEETTVEEDETEEEKPSDEVEKEATETEPFMTIRYNKADKALTKEEAITMAQKGMNYDHMKEKYDTLNNRLSELASMNDMEIEQYLESLNSMQINFAVTKEVKALKERFPNSDEELLKEIAQKRVSERLEKNKAQNQVNETEKETKKNEIKRQVELFEKRYPELDAGKLDPKVYEMMEEGYTLLEAYQEHQNQLRVAREKEEQKKREVERINAKNKKKSLGNVTTNDNANSDEFMAGFMS